MINTLIKKAASSFNKPTVSQPVGQPEPTPQPAPVAEPAKPTPAPAPAVEPKPIDQSPKALAVRAAEAAGYKMGDTVGAEILRHQRGVHPHLLMIMVPDFGEPVRCHVKDAKSWLPVNPPFNRLKARFTGMATNEGELIFESSDICKANRLRRGR
jgi:hypothetical protein